MPIVTATQVTSYTDISASAATITASNLIPVVQERINIIAHNWFLTDLYLQDTMTFNATARTIVADNSFASENFLANDEIYVYHSYRNDGYYTISTVSAETLTLVTGSTVVEELSGRSIMVSVVSWPDELAYVAAQMVYYDYDIRKKRSPGVTSQRLGPWSESYGNAGQTFGYPDDVVGSLLDYRVVSVI